MNLATIERVTPGIDWVSVKRQAKMIGFGMGMFALGGWVVSIRAQEASLPYKEASTHQLETLKRTAGPNPGKTIDCLTKKADKAEDVAVKAVQCANDLSAPVPSLAAIPDCPVKR